MVFGLRIELANSKVGVKTESLYFNKLLSISPFSSRKTDLQAASGQEWRGRCEIIPSCRRQQRKELGDSWKLLFRFRRAQVTKVEMKYSKKFNLFYFLTFINTFCGWSRNAKINFC